MGDEVQLRQSRSLPEFIVDWAVADAPSAILVATLVMAAILCLTAFIVSSRLVRSIIRKIGALLLVSIVVAVIWIIARGQTAISPLPLSAIALLYLLNVILRYAENADAGALHENVEREVLTQLSTVRHNDSWRLDALEASRLRTLALDRRWKPYAIFLRPFAADNYAGTSRPMNAEELSILDSVEKSFAISLLSVGDNMHLSNGAARVKVPPDKEWQDVVLALLLGSEFIILWPSTSDGTRLEIDWCVRYFWHKTIFFQPGVEGAKRKNQAELIDAASVAKAQLGATGVEVPPQYLNSADWANSAEQKLIASPNLADVVAALSIEVRR